MRAPRYLGVKYLFEVPDAGYMAVYFMEFSPSTDSRVPASSMTIPRRDEPPMAKGYQLC